MIITLYEYNLTIRDNSFEKNSIQRSQILNYINKDGYRGFKSIECIKAFNKVMHHIHKTFELEENQSCNLVDFKDIN